MSLLVTLPVVIVGIGQLGAAFAEGFLRLGHPVFPVTRKDSVADSVDAATKATGEPPLVVVAVGEDDLGDVLENVPTATRDRVVLLQNELRESIWREAPIEHPNVAVVWFEKKQGKPVKEVLPSWVAGPQCSLLAKALNAYGVTAKELAPHTEQELAHQLALKNLYVLSLNLLGLRTGGTAGELLRKHAQDLERVVSDLIELEKVLTDQPLDALRLRKDLHAAIQADPDHGCAGRSAPRRLQRTRDLARRHELELPVLEALYQEQHG